jgi:hypothetical protein
LLLVSLMLTGCQVLASVFEEQVLRTAAIVLCVAVVIGFVVARMRR